MGVMAANAFSRAKAQQDAILAGKAEERYLQTRNPKHPTQGSGFKIQGSWAGFEENCKTRI